MEMLHGSEGRRPVTANPANCLGAQTVVLGNIRGAGDFVVHGEVQGEGEIDGSLFIAEGGRWLGDIVAVHVVIAGSVIGDIQARESLELRGTARIIGNLSGPTISVAMGASYEGQLRTLPLGVQQGAQRGVQAA